MIFDESFEQVVWTLLLVLQNYTKDNPVPDDQLWAKPFVDQIVNASTNISHPAPEIDVEQLLAQLPGLQWARSTIGCQMAEELIESLNERVGRVISLSQVARPECCSPSSIKLFKRVARCYVSGFSAECIVMCRALVEAEINAEISYDDCIAKLGLRRPKQPFDLADKIQVASLIGRLSYEGRRAADHVRAAGNQILHRPHQVTPPDDREVISEAMQVLADLDRTRQ